MLTTTKAILVQRNRPVLASLAVIASQIIFYKLIDSVGSSENDLALYIVSIASGVGTFLALKVNAKFSKERTFVNVILSDVKEAMIELREFLKDHKITNLTTDGYTKDWKRTIAIIIFLANRFACFMLFLVLSNNGNLFFVTELVFSHFLQLLDSFIIHLIHQGVLYFNVSFLGIISERRPVYRILFVF